MLVSQAKFPKQLHDYLVWCTRVEKVSQAMNQIWGDSTNINKVT